MALPPDVVYGVRPGDINEELRYSLRSVAKNVPHETVWIVGDKPEWVRGVEFIRGNSDRNKWRNLPLNLLIASTTIPASHILVMNDDFFVMRRVRDIPFMQRSYSLAEQIDRARTGPWRTSLRRTMKLLNKMGIEDPASYELHMPVVMETSKLAEVCRIILADKNEVPAQWRTVYGNMYHVRARQRRDHKSQNRLGRVFMSTDETWWRGAPSGIYIRDKFKDPSPYEDSESVEIYSLGRTGMAKFRNLKYPALRLAIAGQSVKFVGGRLDVQGPLADAVRIRADADPSLGIVEVAIKEDLPEVAPEAAEDMGYRDLQAALKERGMSAAGSREELLTRLVGDSGS